MSNYVKAVAVEMAAMNQAFALQMDPEMEAFFIAVALEMGTRPLPEYLANRTELGLPLTEQERELVRNQALHTMNVREFMKGHPGAPPVLARVKRAHRELAGGLSGHHTRFANTNDIENRFWGQLCDAYVKWCARESRAGGILCVDSAGTGDIPGA